MNAPKGPFWAWQDIGQGFKWHICQIEPGDDDTPMIHYLTEDFKDFWYDDDWDEGEIKLIKPPARLD